MTCLPYRRTSRLMFALLLIGGNSVAAQTQTPGQVTKFDPSLNVVDSVITEDPSGNIGIGTFTPFAKLDVFGGNLNLENSTGATGNILKGGALFMHNFGIESTFVGIRAGNLAITGARNTAAGYEALENTTTGYWNTATGARALENNTNGNSNTATGVTALLHNTSGYSNTAIGAEALLSNTTGAGNIANGSGALNRNVTGSLNTAIGFGALLYNIDGQQNTATGRGALSDNGIVGGGSNNTANGDLALFHNQRGDFNTAVGAQGLAANVSGNYNTAIGGRADVAASNLTNATAIGALAIVDASNKIRFGNSQVTVIEGQVPYTFTSDRNQKEHFQPVDGEAVLKKVSGLNVSSWNYIGHNPQQFRHYGPVAQEFFAAFGHDAVGIIGTPTTINSGDLEGILMVAVQALEKRTAENADLRSRIEALEKLVKPTHEP